jgi:hypothetical protein
MTRVLNKILAASMLAAVVSAAAFAADNSLPSSKSTAMAADVNVLQAQAMSASSEGWTTILSSAIKTSNPADLFVNVSLECGLYTSTVVKSKNGSKDTSSAYAGVKVQVMLDGNPTMPGDVTFCERKQELTATFQGLLTGEDGSSCLVTNALMDENGTITGYTTTIDENCTQPEEVGLLLDTMSANAFNFIAADVGAGIHTIEVQAKLETGSDYQNGSAEAYATIGKGSAVVDETKMIKDATVQQ